MDGWMDGWMDVHSLQQSEGLRLGVIVIVIVRGECGLWGHLRPCWGELGGGGSEGYRGRGQLL